MKRTEWVPVVRQLFALFFVITLMGSHSAVSAQKDTPDYSLGRPRLWMYQRVYPFLDGIFQDVASTQVAPLTLNPNNANAGQLDALITSWAAGVSFSATQGAQNALAQQQNQLSIANTQLQSQLLSQQQQLTQQLVAATKTQGQAQAAVDQLKAQPNPDPTQLAQAQGQLAVATDNVNSLTSQLNLVKAQVPSAAPTFSQPNPSQPTGVTLPTQLSSLTTPPGAPNNPNFPVSKQMDNQVNLLWERLSRLVGTIAQADSLKDYDLVLAAFDVNLMPNREDKKIFAVEYQATAPSCGVNPLAVDLFPSASAVNIVNNQYKDSRGAIGIVLSWFSWGLNAAYNRDHLQITQALGQSAYITGFGAGQSEFGWAFGRNLGDKSVSPGKRTVFAIIAVPKNCSTLTINSKRAGWFGEKSDDWYSKNSSVQNKFVVSQPATITQSIGFHRSDPVVSSVAYTPVEFDSTATSPSVTALRINLDTMIDPQMTVSLNGQVIPRARDTFARAVQSSGGSGGLLESSSYTVNTWIPTSSWTVTISLDASKFEKRFPDVVLTTAQGITPLSSIFPRMTSDGKSYEHNPKLPTYVIAGEKFGCQAPCDINMPPLGYRKATWQALSVFRRPAEAKDLELPDIVLSLAADTSGTAGQNSGASNVQILAAGSSPWGGNVVVLMGFQEGYDLRMLRLVCSPLVGTLRLGCRIPSDMQGALDQVLSFELHDPDHAGGAVSARAVLDARPKREPFIVWSIGQPQWLTKPDDPKGPELLLCATFMIPKGNPDTFTLGFANGTPLVGSQFKFLKSETACHADTGLWTGGVRLSVDDYMRLTDQLTILHDRSNDPPATLLNLHIAGEPVVTVASSDYLQLYGQNLIFGNQLQIDTGPLLSLACDFGGTSCQINPPKPAPQKPATPATPASSPASSPAAAPASHGTPATTSPASSPAAAPANHGTTATGSPANSPTAPTQATPAAAAKPKPEGNKPAATTPKNPLGDRGGPIYIVYAKDKHSMAIPIMKNTNGTLAAFLYVPPSVTPPTGAGTPATPPVASGPSTGNNTSNMSAKSALVVQ